MLSDFSIKRIICVLIIFYEERHIIYGYIWRKVSQCSGSNGSEIYCPHLNALNGIGKSAHLS